MVWYGMVWYGMVWYGMAWYGMVDVCDGYLAAEASGSFEWLRYMYGICFTLFRNYPPPLMGRFTLQCTIPKRSLPRQTFSDDNH